MRLPKMILFDYGFTLLCEPGFDSLRGERAVFEYVVRNRDGISAEELDAFSRELIGEFDRVRSLGLEFHNRQFQRMLYEGLGIELSISLEEAEEVFWDGSSVGAVMPNAGRMLDALGRAGIRSGVISNISFSENALRKRIDRLLPGNRFEFVMASSEYGFRKPSPLLFRLALQKAGLPPEEVWFCGDNIEADVEGAAAVGMFPVWYEDLTCADPGQADGAGVVPGCEHLHIHDWQELIDLLG